MIKPLSTVTARQLKLYDSVLIDIIDDFGGHNFSVLTVESIEKKENGLNIIVNLNGRTQVYPNKDGLFILVEDI